ncbi:MAG: hypothetical protein IJS86_06005, partial [Lachnospiraceae bacterium]|nr:hypothetical protein [Lachnospiraceae bacterium]
MSKVHSSKKKHVKQVVSFLLSFIIIFTAHPLSFAYGAEEKPVDIIQTVSDNEPSGTEETGTVSDNEPSDAEGNAPVSINEPVDINSNPAASADTVTGEPAENIPFGAFDDDIEIENPEPLEEFKTPVSEGEDAGKNGTASIMSHGIQSAGSDIPGYAVSYNGVAEGLLPDSLRHQGNSSLCWAFSAALLAEVSMIKNRLAPRSVRYSEDQIGYFFYHHQTDPLGGTVSDETIIVPSYATYYNKGGNNFFTNWSLASWTSVRNQEDLPFRDSAYTVSEVTPDLAYNSVAHMQNSYWFNMASTGDDISYVENVKELVYRFGAASVIIKSYPG